MITFITSIRHPLNCNGHFEYVLNLLEQTLFSISRQNIPHFRIIVVANEPFTLPFKDERIEYLWVDFPPPSDAQQASFGMQALRIDRGCKYLIGLMSAKKQRTDHIMFVDADDYVSNKLAALSESYPSSPGWFIDRGYLYDRASGEFGLLDDFHRRCGTSHIMTESLLPVPPDLQLTSSRDEILKHVPEDYLLNILGSHRSFVKYFAEQGAPLEKLPFPGAVYHIGHGENHTARSHVLELQPLNLSKDIRLEFTIPYELNT